MTLGGAWDLDAVTGALTRFADAAAAAALACVLRSWRRARAARLAALEPSAGPIPGLFGLAMGKAGAFELNYSSDLDISLFWEPETLQSLADGVDPQSFVDRCARTLTSILSERHAGAMSSGLDLRLRPDPAATPARRGGRPRPWGYYQSVGQNWERAAFVERRAAIGDLHGGAGVPGRAQPFVRRRSLDFAAISDIQSIKRQIHVHHVDERLDPRRERT